MNINSTKNDLIFFINNDNIELLNYLIEYLNSCTNSLRKIKKINYKKFNIILINANYDNNLPNFMDTICRIFNKQRLNEIHSNRIFSLKFNFNENECENCGIILEKNSLTIFSHNFQNVENLSYLFDNFLTISFNKYFNLKNFS